MRRGRWRYRCRSAPPCRTNARYRAIGCRSGRSTASNRVRPPADASPPAPGRGYWSAPAPPGILGPRERSWFSPLAESYSPRGAGAIFRQVRPGPKLRRLFHPGAPDGDVTEIGALHLVGAIDVAQIDNDGARHGGFEPAKIERAELVPFGGDHQRFGAGRGLIGAAAIGDRRQRRLGLLHAGGIVGAHRGPEILERRDQRDRRRIARVIGVRLE